MLFADEVVFFIDEQATDFNKKHTIRQLLFIFFEVRLLIQANFYYLVVPIIQLYKQKPNP